MLAPGLPMNAGLDMPSAGEAQLEQIAVARPMSEVVGPLHCAACEASSHEESQYLAHAFGGTRRIAQIGESLADSLGYCAPHGGLLARHPEFSGEIAAVLADAAERLYRLRDDAGGDRERLEQILFGADRACPACRFIDHHDATVVARLGKAALASAPRGAGETCFAHFQSLYLSAPAAAREPLFEQFREVFEQRLETCMAAPPDENGTLDDSCVTPDRVDALLRALAGPAPARLLQLTPGAQGLAPPLPDPTDWSTLLRDPAGCPICHEVHRGALKWIESMRLTVRLGQPLWLAFPTCAEHVWLAATQGGAVVAAASAQYVAAVAHASLRERRWPFARPAPRAANPSHTRRRRAKTADVPAPREPKARPARCQACERLAVASDVAIERLLVLLEEPQHRAALESGYGLCLKHFARAYVLLPNGRIRSFLTALHLGKLPALGARLRAIGPTVEPVASSNVALLRPWQLAIRWFSGDPWPATNGPRTGR